MASDFTGEGVTRGIDLLIEVASCVVDYDEMVKNLENESGESEEGILYAKLVDVKKAVQKAKDNGQEIKNEVESWIKNSENTRKTATALLEKIERSTCCLCMGFNMNCLFRYVNAKEAKRIREEIKARITEGGFATQGGVSTEPPPLPLTCPHGYVDLDSRTRYLEILKGWLVDEEKLVIGVHGHEGAGKTMVVENLAWVMELEGHFNHVVLIRRGGDVVKNDDLFNIQQLIGERVGFGNGLMKIKSLEERKRFVEQRLTQATKVLIIIDHVEEKIDTNLISIPWPRTINDSCRIVVVSRILDVCIDMGTHMNLEVGPLSQAESLHLFDQLRDRSNLPLLNNREEIVDPRRRIESRDGPWLPGQLKAYVSALQKLMIVQIGRNPNGCWDLMLPAVAFRIEHSEKKENWKWSLSMEAEILHVGFLYIRGLAKAAWLHPNMFYGAYFVYKFIRRAEGFDECEVQFTIGIRESDNTNTYYLRPPEAASRNDGWMEIKMGQFYNEEYTNGFIRLEVREESKVSKTGLVFRGIELRALDKK